MDKAFKSYECIKSKYDRSTDDQVYGISVVGYQLKPLSYNPSSRIYKGKLFYQNDEKHKLDRNVCFLSFGEDESLAKTIFKNSMKISHPTLLKIWCVAYCEQLQSWLICYDDFEHTLKKYVINCQPFKINSSCHVLTPWWAKTIRELLSLVEHFHTTKYLLHKGLSNIEHYVVVDDDLKLLNLASSESIEGITNVKCRQNARKKDMADLKKLLSSLLAIDSQIIHIAKKRLQTNIEAERDSFLKFMDGYPCSSFSRICNHPFLLGPLQRLVIFVDVFENMQINGNTSNALSRLTEFAQWQGNSRSRALQSIYSYKGGNYSCHQNVQGLIRFLRNLATHGNFFSHFQYDHDVMDCYPNLLIKIYELLSFLGTHQ